MLGTARALGLEKLLDRRPSRRRSLALALIAGRVLDPRSKLATARGLSSATQADTLGEELGTGDVTVEELHEAMDWLLTAPEAHRADHWRRSTSRMARSCSAT